MKKKHEAKTHVYVSYITFLKKIVFCCNIMKESKQRQKRGNTQDTKEEQIIVGMASR
jgi:hypothetical protein